MWLIIPIVFMIFQCRCSHNEAIFPEQVHITLADLPNSMLVQWVTMKPINKTPFVKYGHREDNLDLKNMASVEVFNFNNVLRYMYTAEMTNLDYNSTYYYSVGVEPWMSRVFKFKTFPNGTDFSFKICIFGDLGVNNGVSASYLIEAAERGDFDLAVQVGDIAYDLHADDGRVGDLFMNQMEPMFAQIPFLVIAGNHEDDGKNFSTYRYRFNMPNDPFGDSQVYSFDLGPVHFMGISTEYYGFFYEYGHEPVINQYNWLKDDLKKARENRLKTPWIISWQHRPFYCSNSNSFECESFENTLIRVGFEDLPGLESLFTDYGMDLSFAGHEHSFERFFPISNRFVYNLSKTPYHNAMAPVYIITGSAGCHSAHADFNEKTPNPGSASRFVDYGYTILHVHNKTHVYLEQISVERNPPAVIDSFWLTKVEQHVPSADKALNEMAFEFPAYVQRQQCNVRDPRCRAKRDVRLRRKRKVIDSD